jgi:hypothetical protein
MAIPTKLPLIALQLLRHESSLQSLSEQHLGAAQNSLIFLQDTDRETLRQDRFVKIGRLARSSLANSSASG